MRDRARILAALAGVVILAAIVYSASFSNGFLSWDDPANVTSNAAIRSLTSANLRTYFTTPLLGVYSPLVYLSYALDYRIGGLNPSVYHATNLALHLVCVLLIYAVVRRLTGRPWAAVVVAALFAVHPANVAAVTPISVRSSLLYAAFYLAAYLSYVGQTFRFAAIGRCFVFFLLACLSKPAAVTFPVLLLATDLYRGRRLSRAVLLEKLPFIVVSVVIGLVALRFRTDMATGNPLDTSWLERSALAAYQLGFYALHAIVPANLSAYYPYPERSGGSLPTMVWVALVTFAIVVALVAGSGSRRKWLTFGLLVFALHLVLVLKLVPMGAEFTADRYLYVPLLGVAILAVEAIVRLPRTGQRAAMAGALIVIAAWSAMSWRHQRAWRDDMTFYTRIIDRFPGTAVALANRSATRLQQNDVEGAWRDSTEAVRLDPTNVQGFFNRATAEVLQGRVRDALEDANRAVTLDPKLPASYALRAQIHLSIQNYPAARDDAGRAIELAPNADDVFKPLVTRGMARAMLGDGPGALADLDRAILVHPQEPALFYNRGQVRLSVGDIPGGCADLRMAAAAGRNDAAAMATERCQGR